MNREKDEMEDERHKSLEECESIRREQEDLLVLMSDQDSKIDQYKKRLRELGEKVCMQGTLCLLKIFSG